MLLCSKAYTGSFSSGAALTLDYLLGFVSRAHLGCNVHPGEGGFTPLPCRGIGSRSRREAAFPTLFNSVLHTRSWSLSRSPYSRCLSRLKMGNCALVLICEVLTSKLWLRADGFCRHSAWLGNVGLPPMSFTRDLHPPKVVSVLHLRRSEQHGLLHHPVH